MPNALPDDPTPALWSSEDLLLPEAWAAALEVRHHAISSSSWDVAVEITARMSSTLESLDDREAALSFQTELLSALPPDEPAVASLLLSLGSVYGPDQYEDAREALLRAEKLYHAGDTEMLAEARLRLGILDMLSGNYVPARAWFDQALACVHEGDYAYMRARIVDEIGMLERREEHFDASEQRHLEALAFFEQVRSPGTCLDEFVCLSALASLNADQAKWDAAIEFGVRALDICRQLGRRESQAELASQVASWAVEKKDYGAARDWFREALGAAAESGAHLTDSERRFIAHLHLSLGGVFARQGVLWAAIDHASEAQSIAPPDSDVSLAAGQWLNALRDFEGKHESKQNE
jgi:tetratricopeptide (TPR) repeat protein